MPHVPNSNPNPHAHSHSHSHSSDFLDLNGYYGLFESRGAEQGLGGLSGLGGMQGVEAPVMGGWAFMQELGEGEGEMGWTV